MTKTTLPGGPAGPPLQPRWALAPRPPAGSAPVFQKMETISQFRNNPITSNDKSLNADESRPVETLPNAFIHAANEKQCHCDKKLCKSGTVR
ncbi:hypothetical protein QU487_00045 [Crenobacter sp. SG2305]|uniref:hypothetical protein n=1 Tax=Crenobacter oryzisoli TaxID=3056844 RepID=UPI0025AAE090|nr:hypothetical protein [Crenobacter sp. SG2305]MDN0081148.1 hypothetical protein [Crenobacter sp. SG2305]